MKEFICDVFFFSFICLIFIWLKMKWNSVGRLEFDAQKKCIYSLSIICIDNIYLEIRCSFMYMYINRLNWVRGFFVLFGSFNLERQSFIRISCQSFIPSKWRKEWNTKERQTPSFIDIWRFAPKLKWDINNIFFSHSNPIEKSSGDDDQFERKIHPNTTQFCFLLTPKDLCIFLSSFAFHYLRFTLFFFLILVLSLFIFFSSFSHIFAHRHRYTQYNT